MGKQSDSGTALRLGVVGLGHWFEMIHRGISKNNAIVLTKVVGTRTFEQKIEELRNLGISEANYFRMGPDLLKISEGFFADLDIVQISNPNKYHSAQTKQALEKNLYVVTEKALATNKNDFEEFITFIKENNYQDRIYLHLHYVHKLLNLELPAILEKTIPKHGRITGFSGTFFEEANESDRKRSTWLFSSENGGIFMDWIHPYEVLFFGAKAKYVKILKVNNLIVNSDYDKTNPTGVETFLKISGENFTDGAGGVIRISKGLPHEIALKRFIFTFESGAQLFLNFVGSQIEFNSDDRGNWQLVMFDNGSLKVLDSGMPKGPATSELLVEDILRFCKGNGPYIKVDDITKIFEPQWEYQRITRGRASITDPGAIEKFMRDGLSGSIDE